MPVITLTLVQSLILIFGLAVAFFGRDYSLRNRGSCRKAFALFSVLLVITQFSYLTNVHAEHVVCITEAPSDVEMLPCEEEFISVGLDFPIHAVQN